MGGIRKNKKRKKYQFDRNRKRMNKRQLPKIKCAIVEEKWNKRMSCVKNMKNLGLAFDVNKDITLKSSGIEPEEAPVTEVIQKLEEEAHAPVEKGFRITKNQVEFLTYMLDKYGEDYKSMTLDKRNILQLTWKQFRRKIKMFKSIPEQYGQYLQKKEESSGMAVN